MTKSPNLLWIMADQMRGDCLGCVGHPHVLTPNLDRLASHSAVFERAFAQAPICSPSRACLFTGRYVHEHGVWWNGVPFADEAPLLPELLREAGCHTGIVGKLHFAPPERAFGFAHKELHEERLLEGAGLDAYERMLGERGPAAGPRGATEWSDTGSGVGVCRLDESLEETRWVADRACRFLRERTTAQPFFLFASFMRPHSPYNPLARFAELYADAQIAAPEFSREEWNQVPPRVRATAESWGWDRLTAADFAEIRRHYYALCSQVDDNVGRILAELERLGLDDSTIVVFCSDHGDFLGEHGLLFKEHLYEGALHVPLLIRDPRRGGGPVRCPALVETIDVMPTVLDYLGLPVPEMVEGASLASLADPAVGEPALHAARIYSHIHLDGPLRMSVVEGDWKMIEQWNRP